MLVPSQLSEFIPEGGKFVNTEVFSEVGTHFSNYGFYCGSPPKTKEYYSFWDREIDRCINGYEVDDVRITGHHYFYLNYCPIPVVDINDEEDVVTKVNTFPRFWDTDYYYFHALDKARKLGKHLIVIKARGKGYSHKNSAILARDFHLKKNYKSYALAFEKEFLIKDGLLSKTWEKIDFIGDNTAWTQPRLIDQDMHKSAGYRVKIAGNYITRGRKNEIIGVSLKNDPNKARGKRGGTILWEEGGKFPGLFTAFDIARPSVEEGKFATGIMIVFGTGGTNEGEYESLEKLFYNPEANNCMVFDNIWDDGATGNTCGFFVPAFDGYEGFIDVNGNSDYEGAKKYINEQRELKKKGASDSRGYNQFVAEFPFTPREATLKSDGNLFPIKELQVQLDNVLATGRHNALSCGILFENYDGKISFKPTHDVNALFEYPVPKEVNTDGCITILEAPFKDRSGNIPQGLYYIGHDPYAHDQTVGTSLGATYVFKMTNNFSPTYNDCIVAGYVGRPSTQDEYNKNLFHLAEYYGCKIGFENDRGDVIGYGKRHKMLHYLAEEFRMLDKRELQSRTVKRAYGMHMTVNRKSQGEIYIRDWLNTKISNYEDGTERLMLHTIVDPALLQELIKFNHDGNFDRVMAVMIGMYHMKELYNSNVAPKEDSDLAEFFSRELFPAA